MKSIKQIIMAGVLACACVAGAETNTTRMELIAQEATAKLQETLGSDLKRVLKKRGVVEAAKFCSSEAQNITMRINKELGGSLMIHRTSLRYRNPANAPIEEEKEILEALQTLRKHHVVLPHSLMQKKSAHHYVYYKPIFIENRVCLKCHGMSAKIDKRVKRVIADNYINDPATGYRMGDLRGLFVVDIKTDTNDTK